MTIEDYEYDYWTYADFQRAFEKTLAAKPLTAQEKRRHIANLRNLASQLLKQNWIPEIQVRAAGLAKQMLAKADELETA